MPLKRQAQLLQDRLGVLAQSGDRPHEGLKGGLTGWRPQGRQWPAGRVDAGPALARLQLRVSPDLGHGVHARIGDLGLIESLGDLRAAQAGKNRRNECLQRLAVFAAPGNAVMMSFGAIDPSKSRP